jgi:hypothetical protein
MAGFREALRQEFQQENAGQWPRSRKIVAKKWRKNKVR